MRRKSYKKILPLKDGRICATFKTATKVLRHSVELLSKSALFISSVILMNDVLIGSVVNSLDGNFIGTFGCFAVALGYRCVKLLNVSFENRFLCLVAGVPFARDENPLGRRFNIGHSSHLLLQSHALFT